MYLCPFQNLLHYVKRAYFLTIINFNLIWRKSLENCKNWFMLHIKCYLSVNVRCLICCYLAPVNKNLCRVSFLIAHNRTSLSLIYGRLSCHKYLRILLKLLEVNLYCRYQTAKYLCFLVFNIIVNCCFNDNNKEFLLSFNQTISWYLIIKFDVNIWKF